MQLQNCQQYYVDKIFTSMLHALGTRAWIFCQIMQHWLQEDDPGMEGCNEPTNPPAQKPVVVLQFFKIVILLLYMFFSSLG